MSAIQQFEDHIEKQKAKGLLSIAPYWGNTEGMTYESFCEEYMRMVNAPDVEDKELF